MNIAKLFWGVRSIFYKFKLKKIGFFSYIGKPIFIANGKNVCIGARTRIYPGMRIELVNTKSFLTIGNNVSIGQNFHAVSYNDNLVIGNDVTISGNVLITNCDHSYRQIGLHILDQPLISKPTRIGNGSFIGYGAVLQAGSNLGKQCIVGANSVVRGDFPDYSVIAGIPAKIIKYYSIDQDEWIKK